jgi:Activator of Hsp90 ATPase homolog 1-like protein
MSTHDYTTSFTVEQAPAEAFAAITDVRGWWGEDIDGATDKLGDEFTYRYRDIHYSTQKITELVADQKIVWRVQDSYLSFAKDTSEWNATEIVFEVAAEQGKTVVRFTHKGLAPEIECFEVCSNAWSFYVNTSLRSLIATGKDQPNAAQEATASM